jgi:transposase-like protein
VRRADSASSDRRLQLLGFADAARPPLATRSRAILKYLDGQTPQEIASDLGVSPQTVRKWRKRYLHAGLGGLYDRPRPGRPRQYSAENLYRLINQLLQQPLPEGQRWSVRRVAEKLGLSTATVGRAWKAIGLAGTLSTGPAQPSDPEQTRRTVGQHGRCAAPQRRSGQRNDNRRS